jgi:hypothetical protein
MLLTFACKFVSLFYNLTGVNFINVLHAHFLYKSMFLVPKCRTKAVFTKILNEKCARKMLMKLTTGG